MRAFKFIALMLALLIPHVAWGLDGQLLHNDAGGVSSGAQGMMTLDNKFNTVTVEVVISGTAQVDFKASVEGGQGFLLTCTDITSTGLEQATGTTQTKTYSCPATGLTSFQAVISSWSSGTVRVYATPSVGSARRGGGGGSGGSPLPATTIFTSESAPLKICGLGALTDDCYYIYTHSNGTPTIVPVKNGVENDLDIKVVIGNGHSWSVSDYLGNLMVTLKPDASGRLKYVFGPNYRLRKTMFLPADSFYMHGCTLTTDQALIPTGLVEPYITCGDNDNHGFHRTLVMPLAWAADSFTVTQYATNVNATPSATAYAVDYSAECEANSDVIATSISATGEQRALINFANTGTCGTACAQSDLTIVTTSAITPNGGAACAGGNLFRLQGNVDATATTTGQVADVKIILVKVDFNLATWGE